MIFCMPTRPMGEWAFLILGIIMGLGPKFSSDSYPTEEKPLVVVVDREPAQKLPNPDPANYEILEDWACGDICEEYYLVVRIKYPDCINYEGEKILVYKDITLEELRNQKLIDPHFSDKKRFTSPIARFVPTQEGWNMAVQLCRFLVPPHVLD